MLPAFLLWIVASLGARLTSGATDGALHTLTTEEKLIGWKGERAVPARRAALHERSLFA